MIRFAQLGLRLLGVMFFVEGVAGVVGSIIYYAWEASLFRDAGYESNPDPYAFGWFAASAISLVAGFYCVTNGRWILEMVFLPSSDESDSEYDAT